MQHTLSITNILNSAENVAVIGASSKSYRTSHHIMKYLMDHNYKVFPVNPNENSVLDENCYSSVVNIPNDVSIDIMVIFRNKTYTADMVNDIVKRSELTGNRPVVWTQLDVSSPEAETLAEKAGLSYVKNRCIMVEHRSVS